MAQSETSPGIAGLGVGLVLLVAVSAWAFIGGSASIEAGPAGVRQSPDDVYNPVTAGEALPDGFRQLLPRDGIQPIYDPTFLDAASTSWPAETDVIGVEIDGLAKAYPVSFLNGRELVVDELSGIPILVSW